MAPDPSVLIEAVKAKLNIETDSELVGRLGWPAHTTSLISKWRTAKNAPGYERTWELLVAGGWLSETAMARDLAAAAERSSAAAETEAAKGAKAHAQATQQRRPRGTRRTA